MKIGPAEKRNNRAGTRIALVLALTLGADPSPAAQAWMFQQQGLDRFIRSGESTADGDGGGMEETVVRRYRNLSGDRVSSLTTGDRLWAWGLDTGGADGPGRDYAIRASDWDGGFDERRGLDEEFTLHHCLK
jgi:hypothetical protein